MDTKPQFDFDWLLAFAAVAEEGGLRKAAARLCITEPPLSRKIAKLEKCLGAALFERHSVGVKLTPAGAEALAIIAPLLREHKRARQRLGALAAARIAALGLTTAFEGGIFAPFLRLLAQNGQWRLERAASPRLVAALRKGVLNAALVALPVDARGLCLRHAGYGERLKAFVPAAWPQAKAARAHLADFNGRPLFWFRAAANRLWHEQMRNAFKLAGFEPIILEEPDGHDVLLARVAAGEGMALMPESFAAISRPGVAVIAVGEESLRLELGILAREENLAEKLLALWRASREQAKMAASIY